MRSTNTLILFVKSPRICRVKTRMQPPFSHRECLFLHRKLAENIIRQCCERRRFELVVYTTTASHSTFPPDRNIAVKRQYGIDLGHRMFNAMQQELKYAQRVVLIGSDSFSLDSIYIENAFARLKSDRDIVIGPTHDGGYALVGMKKPYRKMFEQIAWGTENVLQQTIKQADHRPVHLLETVFDIDHFADLRKMKNDKAFPDWASSLVS